MNHQIFELGLRVALQGESPAALRKALKQAPAGPDGDRLRSLLAHLEFHDELSLSPTGQLRKGKASPGGALLIDALEQLSSGVRPADPILEPLRARLDQLSQIEARLAEARSRVTLLDRINIFTDSPAEAEEKLLKQERKDALRQLKEAYKEYHSRCAAWRAQQESCFLHDRLVAILEALGRVSTRQSLSTSYIDNCPLEHTEALGPECNSLIERQGQRHGFSGDYDSLAEQVCAAEPGEGTLAERLQAHIGNALNDAMAAARLAAGEHREAGQATASAQKEVTLMDKINIFTDSPREKALKEAREAQAERAAWAQRAQSKIRPILLAGLQNFPDAHLYYMCQELRRSCASIRAVCRSETSINSSGDELREETRYWCEIVGVTQARHQAELCATFRHQHHGPMYGLYTHLAHQRLAQVSDPALRQLHESAP